MHRSMTPLLVAVLVTYSAQQLLSPLLAPLSRALLLTETQLGLIVTAAAVTLTVGSPLWGRALDAWSLRAVLLTGIGLATAGLAGFAVVASAGLAGSLSPVAVFVLMLLTRGLLFGAGLAALPVAALAAAGTTTTTEAERTRAVGFVGAAQGLSLVLGPALGGLLAVGSLLLPLYLAPALTAALAVGLLFAVARVPRTAPPPTRERASRLRARDARLLPLLAIGFLLYLSLGFVQVVIGFLLADRLGLDGEATAGAVGLTLFTGGSVLVAAQAALVPRLGWPALRLLRVGTPIALAAYLALLAADQLWSITAAFAVLALGLGLAAPGFSAAPTLVVGADQQGAVAGLVTATIGATFVVGPLAGTALYEVEPLAPVLGSGLAAAAAWIAVWTLPAARRLARPAPADLTSASRPGRQPGGGVARPSDVIRSRTSER